MRRINSAGINLIKRFEGCKLTAYRDPVGIPTIGYGSTGNHVRMGMTISPQNAEDLLLKDLVRFERGVEDRTHGIEITDNEFSAMVSLAFNIGLANFAQSSVLRRTLAGNFQGAADAFLMWDRAGGKVLSGLTRRREAERALFLKE